MKRLAHETGDAFPPTAIEITRMKGCFAWTTADELKFIANWERTRYTGRRWIIGRG